MSDLQPIVRHDVDLSSYHSFGMAVRAKRLIEIEAASQLELCCASSDLMSNPWIILGSGSNTLFTEELRATVLVNRISGRQVTERDDSYVLHLGAGEDWHQVVCWTLNQGMPGLENLALIPGTVGAAPVQNIGAYGAEISQFCEYVEYWDIERCELLRLSGQECQFAYRDSVFKSQLKGSAFITGVGLRLPKQWQPVLVYGPMKPLAEKADLTPQQVFEFVCATRNQKLPDPKKLGNAGSFFKNPVIEEAHYQRLIRKFPDLPSYPAGSGKYKVPAGWLIDRAGLKGYKQGGAAVHQEQALVLVNQGGATPGDVVSLARHVVAKVDEIYGIELEPEVRILDRFGSLCW